MTEKYARAFLLQTALKAAGFDPGGIDGDEGPGTRRALAAYVAANSPKAGSGKPSPLALRMVELARKEVGVRESPPNSNRGEQIQKYQAATWLEGTGWPWCAAFICWLAREAGMPESRRPRTAGAWDFENWAKKTRGVTLFKPAGRTVIRAGDILVLKASHICLASSDQGGASVPTVEGNTDASGGREGGGVYARTRRLSEIRSVIRV